jgi:hypothetical protein
MPIFSVDEVNQTAQLEVVVLGVVVTTFSYANGLIELSERPNPLTMGLDEFDMRLAQIRKWQELIASEIRPTLGPRVLYREVLRKSNAGVTAEFIFTTGPNVTVTDINYDNVTTLVTFAPRPAVTMSFSDFVAWQIFLGRCRQAVTT